MHLELLASALWTLANVPKGVGKCTNWRWLVHREAQASAPPSTLIMSLDLGQIAISYDQKKLPWESAKKLTMSMSKREIFLERYVQEASIKNWA